MSFSVGLGCSIRHIIKSRFALSISAHGNSTFWSRMYSYVKMYYVWFSHFFNAGVSTGQKKISRQTQQPLVPSFFHHSTMAVLSR